MNSLINTGLDLLLYHARLFNTLPHAYHYWAWCVDIDSGWSDSGNLIADDPMNFERDSDTI